VGGYGGGNMTKLEQDINTVILDRSEYLYAVATGAKRNWDCWTYQRKPAFPFTRRFESMNNHMMGAIGEACVAKFLGIKYDGTVNTFMNSPDIDVGDGIEVRTSRSGKFNKIRRNHKPEQLVVFAALTMDTDLGVWLKGWVRGHEGMRDEWLADPGNRDCDVYNVPTEQLYTPDELISHVYRNSRMKETAHRESIQ